MEMKAASKLTFYSWPSCLQKSSSPWRSSISYQYPRSLPYTLLKSSVATVQKLPGPSSTLSMSSCHTVARKPYPCCLWQCPSEHTYPCQRPCQRALSWHLKACRVTSFHTRMGECCPQDPALLCHVGTRTSSSTTMAYKILCETATLASIPKPSHQQM